MVGVGASAVRPTRKTEPPPAAWTRALWATPALPDPDPASDAPRDKQIPFGFGAMPVGRASADCPCWWRTPLFQFRHFSLTGFKAHEFLEKC